MSVRLAGELRTTLSNVGWKAVSMPLEKVCRFLLIWACAPALGTAAFGRFRFAATISVMLGLVMDLGLGVWTVRELARSRERAASIARTLLGVRAMLMLPYLASLAVAALVVEGETRAALVMLGLAALASAFIDHVAAVFRGSDRFDDDTRVNAVRSLLVLAAGLAAIAARPSVAGLTGGVLAGTLGAGLYCLWLVRRRAGARGTYDRALARAAARSGLPICLAGLVSMLYFKADVLILKPVAGDAALGLYSAAYQIFEGSQLVPAIVLAATFPSLARAHLDRERQRHWERLVAAALLLLGLVIGGACYAARGPIIALVFRAGFAEATPVLRILALGIPLMYLNYGLTHFLIARDLGHRNMIISTLMLVVNVSINVVAIPRLAGVGAAWATVATEAALTACCLVGLSPGRYSEERAPLAVSPSVSQKSP
jgi:O-antigen/teichoic acid export membrane protein